MTEMYVLFAVLIYILQFGFVLFDEFLRFHASLLNINNDYEFISNSRKKATDLSCSQ